MINALKNLLDQISIGEMQNYRNVVVFPLKCTVSGTLEYITMTEALESRLLSITEVSASGSVPELKVVNQGEKPILLLDGEEVAGAKQNRVLNTSILIDAKSSLIIPVSCTEQGRWSYVSNVFHDSDIIMATEARAMKVRSVSCSLEMSATYCSDQSEVWDNIDRMQENSGVCSQTGAMKDIYESKKGEIEEALKAFPLTDGQIGLLVVIGGEVAGMDVISSSAAYSKLHPKLIKSYVIEAVATNKPGTKKSSQKSKEKALAFISDLPKCEEKTFKSVGLGDDYRYTGDHIAGSALVYQDCVVHTAFFNIDPKMRDIRMTNLSGRREHYTD